LCVAFSRCRRALTRWTSLKNNVYVGALQLLRREYFASAQFASFVAFLDGLGGVYAERWGDHNIFYLFLRMMGGKSKPLQWDDWAHKD